MSFVKVEPLALVLWQPVKFTNIQNRRQDNGNVLRKAKYVFKQLVRGRAHV